MQHHHAIGLEAIASRLEAIAIRLEAIARWLDISNLFHLPRGYKGRKSLSVQGIPMHAVKGASIQVAQHKLNLMPGSP